MRLRVDVVDALLATRWWNLAPQALGELPTGNVLRFLELATGQPAASIETLRVRA